VSSRPKIVAVAAAAAVVVTFAALPDVTFDSNPIHLRDPQSESIQAIEELAADSEAPLLNVVALAPDEVTAEQWAEALASEPLVREVHGIDSLVPGDQEDKLYVIEDIGLMMGPRFANMDPVAPDLEGLREELTDLREALAEQAALSAAQAVLLSALEDFAAADAGTAAATDARLANLEQDLRSDLPRQLSRLADGLQARAFGREDLPPELAARWIGASQERLIEIVPRENVNDNEAAERFVAAVRRVVPTATGLPVVHREASATVVYSFELALTYALIMVTLLLIVFLRSLSDIVLVVVPIVIAAGATAGLTALLGIPFNFANIIALPLLVGVGVDNGIHMVHRMRTEPPRDGEALGTSTSRAVFASGLTTIASFGNLAFSPHVGMASMGQLLTLGMVVTMAATLLLLPALLKLRSGA
jgi:hopanoid biosynthesis associated RND transporter like protein HpnN